MLNRRWEAEPYSPPLRKVSFSPTDTVFTTLARSEMSAEEKHSAYYNKNELRLIRADNNRIVDDVRTGKVLSNDLESEARGLEYKIRTRGSTDRETSRINSLIAVLQEQDVQEQLYGVVMNDDKIAKAYAKICVHCQLKAIQLAAIDAALVHGHQEIPTRRLTKFPSSKRCNSRRRIFPFIDVNNQSPQ